MYALINTHIFPTYMYTHIQYTLHKIVNTIKFIIKIGIYKYILNIYLKIKIGTYYKLKS